MMRPARRLLPAPVLLLLLALACTPGRGIAPSRNPHPSSAVGTTGRPCTVLRVAPAGFDLPHALQREVAVDWRGKIVVAGGLDGSGRSVAGVLSIEPTTGRTAQIGRMPFAFHDGAGAVIDGVLYVFGGGTDRGTDAVQAFDLSTHRSWVAGHLPAPLSDLAATTIGGGTVYVVGGYDDVRPQNTIYATKDGVHFQLAARLPVGLRYASVATLGSSVVVAGGISPAGSVSAVYVFDAAAHRVATLAHLPAPLAHASLIAEGPDVFVIGGRGADGNALRTIFEITPQGQVRPSRRLAAPLADAAVVADGRVAWLLGGWRGGTVNQIVEASCERGDLNPHALPGTGS
jgi:hypothetical protein